jgi:hypothetical protein
VGGFLQKVVKLKNKKIDLVTLYLRTGGLLVSKVTHFFKQSLVLRYGGLKIELCYKDELNGTDLTQNIEVGIF